jgi:hypothetical protein
MSIYSFGDNKIETIENIYMTAEYGGIDTEMFDLDFQVVPDIVVATCWVGPDTVNTITPAPQALGQMYVVESNTSLFGSQVLAEFEFNGGNSNPFRHTNLSRSKLPNRVGLRVKDVIRDAYLTECTLYVHLEGIRFRTV